MPESSELLSPPPLPPFAAVHLAAAGYLARYSGRTRDAYTLDLKTFFAWCAERNTEVFAMTRLHLEIYVRWMEEQRGYAPATTARRLSTVAGFYRFAVIDGYLDRSPAEYVRRPHVPEESQALGLDRMQLGALVSVARASSPDDAALVTMLGLLGLRISEACGADIADLGPSAGTAPCTSSAKATNPPSSRSRSPSPERWTWPPPGEATARSCGPGPGPGWTATPPPGSCTDSRRKPGSPTTSAATRFATPTSPPPSTPASRCVTSRSPPATPTPAPPPGTTGPGETSTATPTTSSPPSSQAAPDRHLGAQEPAFEGGPEGRWT